MVNASEPLTSVKALVREWLIRYKVYSDLAGKSPSL